MRMFIGLWLQPIVKVALDISKVKTWNGILNEATTFIGFLFAMKNCGDLACFEPIQAEKDCKAFLSFVDQKAPVSVDIILNLEN